MTQSVFVQEIGPFSVDRQDDSRIVRRPHTWAKLANVLFLEAPIGTGFSYAEQNLLSSATEKLRIGDNGTAQDSLIFLRRFLGADYFPQFAAHELHIWGESYAGM